MTEVGKETENEELFPEAVFGEKDYLSEVFGLEQHDIRMYSPLTLAYIGDAAYEIVIRTILVRKANMQVNKLHRHADYRRATGFEALMGYLYLKGDYKRMIDLIRAGLGEV